MQLVAQLFALSTSAKQNFPLMAQSINFTVKTLQALRFGKLNKATNALALSGAEATPVLRVFNELMGALWLEFCRLYRSRAATIVQLGEVVKDTYAAVFSDVGASVERFRVAIKSPPLAMSA